MRVGRGDRNHVYFWFSLTKLTFDVERSIYGYRAVKSICDYESKFTGYFSLLHEYPVNMPFWT